MGDSEKDSADDMPIPAEPLNQDDELPDPDTQELEEGVEPDDLKKTDE